MVFCETACPNDEIRSVASSSKEISFDLIHSNFTRIFIYVVCLSHFCFFLIDVVQSITRRFDVNSILRV